MNGRSSASYPDSPVVTSETPRGDLNSFRRRYAGGSRNVLVSNAFEGKSRLQRQRLVYQAISEEMSGIIHALALKTLTPDEAQKN